MEQATILREAMRFDIDIIRARYANEHALSDGTARTQTFSRHVCNRPSQEICNARAH